VSAVGRPAGFWLRTWAFLVDASLLAVGVALLHLLARLAFEEALTRTVLDAEGRTFARYGAWHGLARDLLGLGLPLLYFSLLEGLAGATPGKRLLGLRVCGPEGRPACLLRSLVRNLAKVASCACCCAGLLPAALSARKRALHDWLAGTDVLRRSSLPPDAGLRA